MARTLFVGTEARVDPGVADPSWNDARRETYLLRRDVRRPLSVDPAVWPRATGDRPRVTVFIGFVVDSAADDARAASQGIEGAVLVIEPSWRAAGFDIADGTISGLSNCGYEAAEAGVLREAWAARLNEHGLFADVHDALAFRALTNERVREHAPFDVFGLWLLEQADAAWAGVKRGIARVKQGLPANEACVFCGAAITIVGLPPAPYVSWQFGCPCGKSNGSIKGL